MFRKTYSEINIDHLEFNISQIRKNMEPGQFLCPMVKANAYGHGDVIIARALEKMGLQHLGVCLIEEGLLLRQSGVQADILVFRGFDFNGAKEIIAQRLTPVVSDWSQLEALDLALASGQTCKIHLKFNTGMNRLGFDVKEAVRVYDFVKQRSNFIVEGVLTHLFQGEDGIDSEGHTEKQLRLFAPLQNIFKSMNPAFHALNSGGFLSQIYLRQKKQTTNSLCQGMWGVRPGLMIYGYNPLESKVSSDSLLPLKPVMNLKSFVNVFRHVPRGEGISYGHTWIAKRDSVIAVVPIGYADGIHRLLSNQSSVLFQGKKVPVVGNICMDYLMLDVTDAELPGLGLSQEEKEVVFFGTDSRGVFLSVEQQAQSAKTIAWEILTSVGERVPRIYRSENKKYQELL